MNAATIRLLVEKGLSGADIAEIAESLEVKKDPTGAERQARYRARRDVTAIEWEAIRHEIFERDNHTCVYCGSQGDLACDHVVPLVQGGLSTSGNLVTACRSCNCEKSGRTPQEWLR